MSHLLGGRKAKRRFITSLRKLIPGSRGGRQKLLNAAGRPAVPLYSMQTCWLPAGICNAVDHKARAFLWSSKSGQGVHLVNWERASSDKKFGGLGIRAARDNNIAMLGKISGKILQGSNKIQVHMFRQKYLQAGHIFNHKPSGSASPVWKACMNVLSFLKDG